MDISVKIISIKNLIFKIKFKIVLFIDQNELKPVLSAMLSLHGSENYELDVISKQCMMDLDLNKDEKITKG